MKYYYLTMQTQMFIDQSKDKTTGLTVGFYTGRVYQLKEEEVVKNKILSAPVYVPNSHDKARRKKIVSHMFYKTQEYMSAWDVIKDVYNMIENQNELCTIFSDTDTVVVDPKEKPSTVNDYINDYKKWKLGYVY